MNEIGRFNVTLFCAALFATVAVTTFSDRAIAQNSDLTIIVDGNPLITPQPAVRQDSDWLVPLRAIARALSVEIETTSDADLIKVRHANGVEYTFNARTGEIRNRYLLIGRVTANSAQFRGLSDELMFPLSGLVALFGVSVEEDSDRNILAIESNRSGSFDGDNAAPGFSVIGLNYNYGLTTNGKEFGQIASLQGQGLLGEIKLTGNLETTRVPGRSAFSLAQMSVRAELPSQRVFLLGDQGTYSGIDALTASVRGLGYEGRFRGFSSYYYAGRGRGSTSAAFGSSGLAKYDTTIGGFALRRRKEQLEWSFAGNAFTGPARKGTTLGAAFGSIQKRNQFKAQALVGEFSGFSAQPSAFPQEQLFTTSDIDEEVVKSLRPAETHSFVKVKGAGYGFALANTFTPASAVTVTAQTEYYGKNFLAARDESRFTGQTNSVLSIMLRPLKAVSFTGGVSDRAISGQPGRSRGFNYGTHFVWGRKQPTLFGYFRTVVTDPASPIGRFDLRQYSVNTPQLNSYSFAGYYSEIHTGASFLRDLSAFATKNIRQGQLGMHVQLQPGRMHRYGLDWLRNLRSVDSYLRFGADIASSTPGRQAIIPTVSIRLPVLRTQSLQLKYTGEPHSHLFQFELSGPLVRNRDLERNNAGESTLVRRSSLTGRVFFDVDNDGRYEQSVDKPVAALTLWLDNAANTVTDAQGTFRFEQVLPGAHRLKVDLSGVPADLAMANSEERTIAVSPNGQNVQNFRVLRMGRIMGRVTYLDYSADSETPIERALPDARIIVGPHLETYSETNGLFIVGDLLPGKYDLSIDPNSIPEGYVSKPVSITVIAKPGQTEESTRFLLAAAPRPVMEKELPVQTVETIVK